jgi:hypothetical protein
MRRRGLATTAGLRVDRPPTALDLARISECGSGQDTVSSADLYGVASSPSDAVSFRRRVFRASGTTWAALGLIAGTAGCVVLAVVPGKGQVVGAVLAVVFLLSAWRMWNAGIQVDADGVKVVTFLGGSRRVAWEDIDHFAVLPLRRYPYVGHVVLRDGRTLATFGLSTDLEKTERNRLEIQRPIDELNETLADWRQTNGIQRQ